MLKVENLTFEVNENGAKRDIIQNVSFQLDDGEMLVVTGPNGGGKSTLAKVLMGVERASAGRILLDGQDISSLSIDERAKAGLGFAFQQPPRFKGMTVGRLVGLAAGRPLSDDACCEILSRVGLCAREYLKREVDGTLSGGEMKRIEIATVLARHTKLTVFDEPEAGIDLWSFSSLIQTFQDIRRELKGTMIIISHQERILRAADEVLLLDGGRVSESGTAEHMLGGVLKADSAYRACHKQEAVFHE